MDSKLDGIVVMRADANDMMFLRERVLYPNNPEKCILKEDVAAIHLAARTGVDWDNENKKCISCGEIVGIVSLVLINNDSMQFRKLAVAPEWQRIGIGSGLISVAAAEASIAKCKRLFCHARLSAEEFYSRCGFLRCGEPFNKYGQGCGEPTHREMELIL